MTSWQMQQLCRERQIDDSLEAKAESRRREILAERLLLDRVFGNPELAHNDDRAPLISDFNGFISIAHTRSTLLLAVNLEHPIGIDLEGYRDRVLKVRDAFLCDDERQWLEPGDLKAHVVAWTAKEAVFKAISRRSLVKNYRDEIVLEPFSLDSDNDELQHYARFHDRRFTLQTRLGENEVFTLAVECYQ